MKFKTVIAVTGYVEDAAVSHLIFTHLHGGFGTWREMLEDLSGCLHASLEKASGDDYNPESVEEWVRDLNRTTCDLMQGQWAFENLWTSGWQIFEGVEEGGVIEIRERAEHALADPTWLQAPDKIYEVREL